MAIGQADRGDAVGEQCSPRACVCRRAYTQVGLYERKRAGVWKAVKQAFGIFEDAVGEECRSRSVTLSARRRRSAKGLYDLARDASLRAKGARSA